MRTGIVGIETGMERGMGMWGEDVRDCRGGEGRGGWGRGGNALIFLVRLYI